MVGNVVEIVVGFRVVVEAVVGSNVVEVVVGCEVVIVVVGLRVVEVDVLNEVVLDGL